MNKKQFRQKLITLLEHTIVPIEFVSVGTNEKKVLQATLLDSKLKSAKKIPKLESPKYNQGNQILVAALGGKTKPEKEVENEDIIRVWCVDREAWRSFRIDSITSECKSNLVKIFGS